MNWLENPIPLQNYDDKKAERENAYTHFFGSFLSIIGLFLVILKFKSTTEISLKIASIIFAVSNGLLYTASRLYHYLEKGNAKRICRILDHSNIYFLIAGTYTPILLYVGSTKCIYLTFFMWFLALIGVCFTLVFWGRLKPLHPILYLLMGWCLVLFWNDVVPYVPHELIYYLIGGGLTYSIGVVFYAIKKIPHYHAICHLFVLAGSLWFYIGLYRTLL